ncbi:hypothetical protein M5689_020719 [Euphorbia peplus]|nr:hypothetical protein M5689_020719 [Euphorbia peplus]
MCKNPPFNQWLQDQRWGRLFALNRPIIPFLVQDFYNKLRFSTDIPDYFISVVCSRKIVITPSVISEIFSLPLEGTELRGPEDILVVPDYLSTYVIPLNVDIDSMFQSTLLPQREKQLHYLIEQFILPTISYFSTVSYLHRCIIWHVLEQKPLNLPNLIMQYLKTPRTRLGVGSLITHICLCQGVRFEDPYTPIQGDIIDGDDLDRLRYSLLFIESSTIDFFLIPSAIILTLFSHISNFSARL